MWIYEWHFSLIYASASHAYVSKLIPKLSIDNIGKFRSTLLGVGRTAVVRLSFTRKTHNIVVMGVCVYTEGFDLFQLF